MSLDEKVRTSRCHKYTEVLKTKSFPKFEIVKYDSANFSFDKVILDSNFEIPFLVEGESSNFGIQLPPRNFTLLDVAKIVGEETPVRIIEVGSQEEIGGFTLREYADYLENNRSENDCSKNAMILNMISLEFTNTNLTDTVKAPSFVDSIDWVKCYWPIDKFLKNDFPRVQHYCLAGMAGSYTDFHIDFGGTSVWYHILWGKKRFYLIPPSSENLKVYQEWNNSPNQNEIFLGDQLPSNCFYIDLVPGQTLILPSGWIHSVYTSQDSLVFGGNFLHSYSILRQIQSFEIERASNIDNQYMFPYFKEIHFEFLSSILNESFSDQPLSCYSVLTYPNILQIAILCRYSKKWLSNVESKSSNLQLSKWLEDTESIISNLTNLIKDLKPDQLSFISEILSSSSSLNLFKKKITQECYPHTALLLKNLTTFLSNELTHELHFKTDLCPSSADSNQYSNRKSKRKSNKIHLYDDTNQGEESEFEDVNDFDVEKDDLTEEGFESDEEIEVPTHKNKIVMKNKRDHLNTNSKSKKPKLVSKADLLKICSKRTSKR